MRKSRLRHLMIIHHHGRTNVVDLDKLVDDVVKEDMRKHPREWKEIGVAYKRLMREHRRGRA